LPDAPAAARDKRSITRQLLRRLERPRRGHNNRLANAVNPARLEFQNLASSSALAPLTDRPP
jgi:hypothetical protein